jgi:lactonase
MLGKRSIKGLLVIPELTAIPSSGFSAPSTSPYPIPPELASLPVIQAEPWVQVTTAKHVLLEGPAFDRQGNLFVVSGWEGKIYKISPSKEVTTIFDKPGVRVNGSAIHKDGRLFGSCLTGELISMKTDGSDVTYIKVRHQGKPSAMNDLTFDSKGNLYTTEYTGSCVNPTGGIYRFSSDFKICEPVIVGLETANGLKFSQDEKLLWVTASYQLIEVSMSPKGTAHYFEKPFGSGARVRCTFTGGNVDGMAIDVKGNMYVAINEQGRVVITNKIGIPIAQVLMPGRDENEHNWTSNLAFKPGTDEVYVTASSTTGTTGAWIYKFRGLAEGLKLFSHQ